MKSTLLITGLIFGTLAAQAQTDNAIFSPLGYWPICESQRLTVADTPLCGGASGIWVLIMKPASANTTLFRYTITGFNAVGEPVTFHASVDRAETGNTSVVIPAGLITSIHVFVEELTVISARRMEVSR